MSTVLPESVEYGKVRGTFILAEGDTSDADTLPDRVPAQGTVSFRPTAERIVNSVEDIIIIPRVITKTLDANGHFEVDLVATDIEGYNPAGWNYSVTITLTNVTPPWTFAMNVPAGSTQEIADVVPLPASGGIAIVKGDPGVGILSIHDDNGDGIATILYEDGTEEELPLPPGPVGPPAIVASPTQPVGTNILWVDESAIGDFETPVAISGEGPPGALEASVGTIYSDRLGTTGAYQWIRTLAGWDVVYGDTGVVYAQGDWFLNLAHANISPDAGHHSITLRRVNEVVYLISVQIQNSLAIGSTPIIVGKLPTGWRPARSQFFPSTTGGAGAQFDFRGSAIHPTQQGDIWLRNIGEWNSANASDKMWMTEEPWPTSLPS